MVSYISVRLEYEIETISHLSSTSKAICENHLWFKTMFWKSNEKINIPKIRLHHEYENIFKNFTKEEACETIKI